jgi:uncharacterized protein YcbK (DUF882 family)
MLRRDFLKFMAASSLIAAMPALQAGAVEPRVLWLQRGQDSARFDFWTPEGYKAACWLLRDIKADQTAQASMRLLRTVAWMQAWLAAYSIHKPAMVHSGYRTRYTNEKCGGAKASLHMLDMRGQFHAMDIHMDGIPVNYLGQLAQVAQQGGVGFYTDRKQGFVHVDDGRVRYWRG